MKLIYKNTGVEVQIGDRVTLERNGEIQTFQILNIRMPNGAASNGRVLVSQENVMDVTQEFMPGVFKMTWDKREDRNIPGSWWLADDTREF